MQTLFSSQKLWDLVEKGITDSDNEARQRESKRKDTKALFLSNKLWMMIYSTTLKVRQPQRRLGAFYMLSFKV